MIQELIVRWTFTVQY